MIVCSCNVISDQQLRSTLAKAQRLRMSQIYVYLGGNVRCGRCAHTIKRMMDQARTAIVSGSPGSICARERSNESFPSGKALRADQAS